MLLGWYTVLLLKSASKRLSACWFIAGGFTITGVYVFKDFPVPVLSFLHLNLLCSCSI